MSTLVTLNVFPDFAVAAPEELEAAAEAPPSHVPCTATSGPLWAETSLPVRLTVFPLFSSRTDWPPSVLMQPFSFFSPLASPLFSAPMLPCDIEPLELVDPCEAPEPVDPCEAAGDELCVPCAPLVSLCGVDCATATASTITASAGFESTRSNPRLPHEAVRTRKPSPSKTALNTVRPGW